MKLNRKIVAVALLIGLYSCSLSNANLSSIDKNPAELVPISGTNESVEVHQPPSDWNAITASDSQLKYYGYPTRPTDPANLERWKKIVSATWVKPELKVTSTSNAASVNTVSDSTNYYSVSNRWSGYVRVATSYGVNGYWTVPSVSAPNMSAVSAQWVGLGGDNIDTSSGTLAQIGTAARSDNNEQTYYPWVEIYGSNGFNSGNAYTIDSVKVYPGNVMYGWVIITSYNNSNATFNFSLENLSTNVFTSFTKTIPITDNVGSNMTSEWISENVGNYPKTVTDGDACVKFQACQYETKMGGGDWHEIASTDTFLKRYISKDSYSNDILGEPNTISSGGFKIFWRNYN